MAIEKYANGFMVNNVEIGISYALSATFDSNGTNISAQFNKIIHPNVTELLTEEQTMNVDDTLSLDVTDYYKLEIEYTNALNDCYRHIIDMNTISIGEEKAFNNICYQDTAMIVDTLKYYFTEESDKIMFNLHPSNNEGTNLIIKQIYAIDYTLTPPPIILPPNTLRFRFSQSSTDPTTIENNGGTWTKVTDSDSNDWDWTCTDTAWNRKFTGSTRQGLLTNNLDPDIQIIAAGDTSSVTNISEMFRNCNTLTNVSLFDTSNVTNMSYAFYQCNLLTSLPEFNTSNVTNMKEMCDGCVSLTNISLFDTSNVTNMSSMFQACTSLTEIPLFDTSKVTTMSNMCYGCLKVNSGALALYNQAKDTGKVTSHNNTFYNCGLNSSTGIVDLNQIPKSWGGLAAG